MISKTIIKFHMMRFLREYSKIAFYIGVFIIFLVVFSFSRHYPHSGTLDKFIFSRVYLFNLLICLILSSGILGKEISNGFINIILTKPVKKETVYFSKFLATLLFCTSLLLLFLLSIGIITLFIHKTSFPIMPLMKIFILLFIDQVSLISMSIFISVWAPREMNISIMIFVIIVLFFLPNLTGLDFPIILDHIFDFLNPLKSMTISNDFLSSTGNLLPFFYKFAVYLVLIFTAGLGIFKLKEIR